jgi:hypothetical protein
VGHVPEPDAVRPQRRADLADRLGEHHLGRRRDPDPVDPKARLALYSKALKLWVDDGASIPLYQQMDIYGVAKRVKFQALSSEQLVGAWMCLADQKC